MSSKCYWKCTYRTNYPANAGPRIKPRLEDIAIFQSFYSCWRKVDWEHKHPTGVAGLSGSGNYDRVEQVFDVWESAQDLNNFINSRFKPAAERINVPAH